VHTRYAYLADQRIKTESHRLTDCECIVIGAGAVGLAIAAKLANQGRDVLVLEAEKSFGSVTSARNSEVIHAGIYYPKDSLKARLCVDGKRSLYQYCRERHIEHQRCGKLIVATTQEQLRELADIKQRAAKNGVDDLALIDRETAQSLEPQLECLAALHSPSTGIIDSHGLMLSLVGDIENASGALAYQAPVTDIQSLDDHQGYTVSVGGNEPMTLTTRWLINAAGHGACKLTAQLSTIPADQCPDAVLYKGNYFRLQGKAPFSRLIYPVPEPGGLGVHITIDMAGQARFGPDVEPIEHENYVVDPSRSNSFYAAIRKYWPALQDNSLSADYAGIRPKIKLGESMYPDFLVSAEANHGLKGLINLMGIESPGLTSCLAIADYVDGLMPRP